MAALDRTGLCLSFSAAIAFVGCGAPPPVEIGSQGYGQVICAKGTTTKGIDVSHWDGTIDWASVKGAGVEFAFMKASEGTTFVDPMFATNWSGAAASGVVRGAYHFFRPADDPIAQADFFVQTAGVPQPGDLPPTIDLEVTDNLDGATVAQAALKFLQRVAQKTQRTPIVYLSTSFFTGTLNNPSGFDAYTLWIANWQTQCPDVPDPPWLDWSVWQSADNGTVNGIAGMSNVDIDQYNGSLSDLLAFVNGNPGNISDDITALDMNTPIDLATAPSADLSNATGPVDLAMRHAADLAHHPTGLTAHPGCSCSTGGRRETGSSIVFALFIVLLLVKRSCNRR